MIRVDIIWGLLKLFVKKYTNTGTNFLLNFSKIIQSLIEQINSDYIANDSN